ncbi:hypothetical protein [Microbulbifer marinus]|uniref:Uncharacterized protein n=1 Tax=Microbulbifer marinus TaxID=658218 RepID=A0A1H3WM27_9GAMM|nr:hypothetical protein [Microbulbifer marinus]SDZ88179.1 hypothetical protein SAMN05216562_0973 [Microbulbifer marinus]
MKRTLLLLLVLGLTLSVGVFGLPAENKAEKATYAAAQQSAEQSEEPAGQAEAPAAQAEAPAAQAEAPAAQAEETADQEPLIWVFRHRRVKQCIGEDMSLDDSRAKLKDSGVVAHQSHCGLRTDLVFVSGCGEPTGDILLHLIRGNSLDAALAAGYGPAEQIRYQTVKCPNKQD